MTGSPIAQAAALFDGDPGYLNTSSYGLPPRPAFEAMLAAQQDWQRGRTSWEGWAASVDDSRAAFGRLIGVPPERIATGSAVSQLLAPVAAAVPDGGTVLVPDVEFTSAVFPFAVHEGRGVSVRTAPLDGFLDAIVPGVDLVSFSAVQSAGGEVADIPAIAARCREVGALVVLDATQAASWLDLHPDLVDVGVCGCYKWLCSPRGTAFLWTGAGVGDHRADITDRMLPLAAGWFAGADVHSSYYGMPLRLSTDVRRFDISPAWHAWVGAAPALDLLADLGHEAIGEHDIALAQLFLDRLGINRTTDSAIVSVPADEAALRRLVDAGVRFGVRAGQARFGFHLYTTASDVQLAVAALTGGPTP
ncbi:aminotransferase class V-fold PLP-dependent enzyme [Nakamurella sp. YIM 132087]|uniref:Aminotransferase class V-fold PLP-dependent enzyme n=1 Tax=Nakamurella alba TaxID=2665158 RepID=A0A7K1FUI4_9ACTN|nr:aminotransferase class V-fold PLP-dependent enzyme [Nakamurella alba]MTD17009.1 aminotransferase class V-fold PLP-dependent enzyme [Nakamurella alba]